MAEINCPQCKAVNRDTARYCAECGAPLLSNVSRSVSGSPQQKSDSLAPEISAEQLDGRPTQPRPTEFGQAGGEITSENADRLLLERYRILRELGRGGFGAVYSAWDINLNHKCAIKENLETTPEAQRQFSREATVLANLSHPNLPRVTDHFSIQNQGQYLVMDFVEGDDLLSLVERQGKLPVEQAVRWVIQVAEALTYLHGQQPPVLHRDIKPSNIRITPEGKAMLVDFGLVKVYNPSLKTTLGARAVTPGYAPPEQYGKGMTDVRTDIYALGATLYNLLTGQEPLESVQRIAGEKIAPAPALNPSVSQKLGQVLEQAMSLEPAKRYQSAAELKTALQSCLVSPGAPVMVSRAAAPPVSPTMRAPEAALPRPISKPTPVKRTVEKRKTPWLWIGIGAFVLVGFMGVAFLGGLVALFGGSATSTPTATRRASALAATNTPKAGSSIATRTPGSSRQIPEVHSKNPGTYIHIASSEPDTLDPSFDYETTGQGIIFNLYDSLIFFNQRDPNVFVPQLALEVPSPDNGGISDGGRVYRFRIRPDVRFHNGTPLTAEDVAYTFQRGILQGGSASSQWLFTEPLLGTGVYDVVELVDPDLVDKPEELIRLGEADPAKLNGVCIRVKEAIQADNPSGTVTFRLPQPWAPFMSLLATGYGSIQSKEWVIQNGGWDGDCRSWQRFYGRTLEEINQTKLGTSAMGTGPYMLHRWDFGKEMVLRSNEDYWRKEPAWPGAPEGAPAIKEIIIRVLDDFEARFAQLQAGEADSIELDSNANWPKLDKLIGAICSSSDQECKPTDHPEALLELVRGGPGVMRNDIFFNWQIYTEGGNELVGSGKLDGNGIPPDFFSNVHIRRAFAYCYNYQSYLDQVMLGEGIRSINVMLPGMIGYMPESPSYSYDLRRCEDEFRQASFGGASVWESGFRMIIPFTSSSTSRRVIASIFQKEINAINPRFKIEVQDLSSTDYFRLRRENRIPLFLGGWMEDYHDPHNWIYPYAIGTYASLQALPLELRREFEGFARRGVEVVDPAQRAEIYKGFNQLYYEQVPALLLYLTVNRRYQQRWVNGWYDNPIYPGLYFYVLRKD